MGPRKLLSMVCWMYSLGRASRWFGEAWEEIVVMSDLVDMYLIFERFESLLGCRRKRWLRTRTYDCKARSCDHF